MKTENTENRQSTVLPGDLTLAETLTAGIDVTAPNEDPVRGDVLELEPFLKVKIPSRSSRIYDRVE